MAHTERMTGAEAVVKTMEMQGIEYAFGLCGHTNTSLLYVRQTYFRKLN